MPGNPTDSPWYSTPSAARKRKPVVLTLSDEARERLAKLAAAQDTSMSALVEHLILGAKKTRKKR